MKYMSKVKWIFILISIFVLIFAGGSYLLSGVDFLGNTVKTALTDAVKNAAGADLEISDLSGNPFTGLSGTDLKVSRGGKVLISAGSADIKLSVPSLFSGSPRLSSFVVDGLESDLGLIAELLPKNEGPDGPQKVPVDRVRLRNSVIGTERGTLELDDAAVRIADSQHFNINAGGRFDGVPASFRGIVKKDGGNWAFDGARLELADGKVEADGALFPSPDAVLKADKLDLELLSRFVPQIKKYGIKGLYTGDLNVSAGDGGMSAGADGELDGAMLYGIPVSKLKAKADYASDLLTLTVDGGKVYGSSLSGALKADFAEKEPIIDLKLDAENLKFADWKKRLQEVTDVAHITGGVKSLEADVRGPVSALSGQVSVGGTSVSYKGVGLEEINGRLVFEGGSSGRLNLTALYEGAKIDVSGKVGLTAKNRTSLQFRTDDVALDNMHGVIKGFENLEPRGLLRAAGTVGGTFGNMKLNADLISESVELKGIGAVKDIKASLSYGINSMEFALNSLSCLWNGTSVTGKGKLEPGPEGALAFNGTFSGAELENFYGVAPALGAAGAKGTVSGKWKVGGKLNSPIAEVSFNSPGGEVAKLPFGRASGSVKSSGRDIDILPVNVDLAGGRITAKGSVSMPDPAEGGSLDWKVKGDVKRISFEKIGTLLGVSGDMKGEMSGAFNASGGPEGPAWSFNTRGSSFGWQSFRIDDITGTVKGDAKSASTDGIRISMLRGVNLIKGTVSLPESGGGFQDAALDLGISSKNINLYEALRRHLPAVRSVQGIAAGEVGVTGTISDPQFAGKLVIRPFRYRNFLLPKITADVSGGLDGVTADNVRASLEDGEIIGVCGVKLEGEEWHTNVKLSASDIDLKQFAAYLPEKFREKLGGKADFVLNGSGPVSSFEGDGSFKSKEMALMGVELADVNAPFFITEGYAIMEDVRGRSNNGELSGGVALDMRNDKWGGNLTVLGTDVDSFIKQAFPNVSGDITGSGDLKFRAEGEIGRLSTVKASGVLVLHEGELRRFEAVEAAKKFTKGNAILFDTVQAMFNYDGGYLTILPGSQATAPKNDPVYRYIMLDGLIDTKDKDLSLFSMGKVNIRALNAFLGALQGVMNMDIDLNEPLDTTQLIQGIVGGALTGFSKNDFRFVTLNVKGTTDSPEFSNIRVQSKAPASSSSNIIPSTQSDPKKKDDLDGNFTFRFKFEIPVGPGGSGSGSDMGDQTREQILQNALESLIRSSS